MRCLASIVCVFSRSNAGQRVLFDLSRPNSYTVAVSDENDYEAACVAGSDVIAGCAFWLVSGRGD